MSFTYWLEVTPYTYTKLEPPCALDQEASTRELPSKASVSSYHATVPLMRYSAAQPIG